MRSSTGDVATREARGAQGDAASADSLSADIIGIFDAIDVPVVVVGRDCKVARFNRAATAALGLTPSDIGRLPRNIRALADIKDFEQLCAQVIADGAPGRRDIRNGDQWFVLRIAPHTGSDRQIGGAVLTFANVTAVRASIAQAIYEREYTKAILNTVIEPLVVLDSDLRVQTANRAFYAMFGVSREETQDVPLCNLGNDDWKTSGLWSSLKAILSDNSEFQTLEVERAFPIGRRTVLLDARRLSQDGDARNMILLAFRDITERKEAEVLVDSQRQALQLLAEGAPLEDVLGFLAGVVERHSAEGLLASIVPLNEAGTHFQRGLGVSLPDAFNAGVEGVPVSSPNSLCASAVRRREAVAVHDFNQDTAWQPFGKFVAPYGLRSGWSVPIVSSSGRILGTFANYYRRVGDPTPQNRELVDMVLRTAAIAIERRRAEVAVASLAAIVEFSDDAIIGKSLEGVITSWNAGAERLFGYRAEEIIGQPIITLIPPEHHEEEREILERLRRGERIEHLETVRMLKNGQRIDVSLGISPIRDEAGQIIGASKIARDITERKRMEHELHKAKGQLQDHAHYLETLVQERTAQLAKTNNELETVVYSIAHDLRAPLRSMEAFSTMLLDEYGARLDETARDYARRIHRSAAAMDRLTLDLLSYGKVAQAEMALAPVSPQTAWDGALAQNAQAIREKEAHIETATPLPAVRAHEVTLEQVLANLVSNALKFVPPGRQPRIRFRAEENGERVCFWVEDNGVGIAPEYHERIFRVFEQAHGRDFGGTGIGLSIVRKGVERMGGRVGVESAVGQGSRFWIELARV